MPWHVDHHRALTSAACSVPGATQLVCILAQPHDAALKFLLVRHGFRFLLRADTLAWARSLIPCRRFSLARLAYRRHGPGSDAVEQWLLLSAVAV
jgi:hypothetical protein